MKVFVELLPHHRQDGYTAKVRDLPVQGHGITAEEALHNLDKELTAYFRESAVNDLCVQLDPGQVQFHVQMGNSPDEFQ